MNQITLETDKEFDINEKIKYWIDLWDELIKHFNKKSFGLSLINPNTIIKDIIDEIECNKFKNEDNRKYFQQKVDQIIDSDPAINKELKIEFEMIKRKMNSGELAYLLHLCKEIEDAFSKGKYFGCALVTLKKILLEDAWKEKDKPNIKTLSQSLIVEFLLKGYSLKTIGKLVESIFSGYLIEGNRISTDFPHSVEIEDYSDGIDYDRAAYNQAIVNEIDNLTTENRIDRLLKVYKTERRDYYVIIQIQGIKGDIDLNIGKVNFYNPKVKRYLKNDDLGQFDHEAFHTNLENYFINAAVRIPLIDIETAKLLAVEEIEKALDLLRSYYIMETNFEFNSDNYLIVDLEGREVAGGSSITDQHIWYKHRMSLDIERDKPNNELEDIFENVSKFLIKPIVQQSDVERKIIYSMHWYRKAEEAKRHEDKLLSYWIAIENLMEEDTQFKDILNVKKERIKKSTLAMEAIACNEISHYIYNIGWELYEYLRGLLRTHSMGEIKLKLSNELIEKASLRPSEKSTVYLKTFIEALPYLKEEINNELIREKIDSVNNFYASSKEAKLVIDSQLKDIKDDILLIYRYRNKIVHNAHYDYTILPYYVQKAKKYTSRLIRHIVDTYKKNSNIRIEDIYLSQHVKIKTLIDKLDKDIEVNLLDYNN
jgi:hypothetical protein